MPLQRSQLRHRHLLSFVVQRDDFPAGGALDLYVGPEILVMPKGSGMRITIYLLEKSSHYTGILS
ncbi:hypothetical protein D3C79_889900 [compost metagenome]